MGDTPKFVWDAFISHASEDKKSFVEPLALELQKYHLKIWFDKFSLHVGSSLRESIDEGLAASRFGIVVLSHAFFAKNWPKKELNALFSRQVDGTNVILPVWHDITREDMLRYSPLLSDIVALKSIDGFSSVTKSLVDVIRPEAFQFGTSTRDAKSGVDRMRRHLKEKFPALDTRITFGPQEVGPPIALATPSPPEVVASTAFDGMKIDILANDRETYNKAPVSFKMRLTKEDGIKYAGSNNWV
jgi:hypothetical protein